MVANEFVRIRTFAPRLRTCERVSIPRSPGTKYAETISALVFVSPIAESTSFAMTSVLFPAPRVLAGRSDTKVASTQFARLNRSRRKASASSVSGPLKNAAASARFLASAAFAADSQIWGDMRVQNILGYGQEGTLKLGQLFTMLQANYFAQIFLAILIQLVTHYFE